jgi:hypothetical protein
MENYKEGYVKIFRSLQYNWIWENSDYLKWWITILMTANHKDRKVSIKFNLINCNRGQSVKSLQEWAKLFNCGKQTVRNFFKLLQKDKMILLENLKVTTRLTICNYEDYQDEKHAPNTQVTHIKHAPNTQVNTNNNVKNVKNVNNSEVLNLKNSNNSSEKDKNILQYPDNYRTASECVAEDKIIKENAANGIFYNENDVVKGVSFERWHSFTDEIKNNFKNELYKLIKGEPDCVYEIEIGRKFKENNIIFSREKFIKLLQDFININIEILFDKTIYKNKNHFKNWINSKITNKQI